MKPTHLSAFVCLGLAAFAQDVRFDYDRSANFNTYKTYQWVESKAGRASDQLMDQNIKRAVDEQLAMKGLRRVENAGELQVGYQVALDKEKQFNAFGMGPRWNAVGRVNSSTIDIGKIVVDLFDPAKQQLVWRGDASKTLDIKKDPDKNYKSLEKAMARLFKNYPPAAAK